jgi:Cu-Zn family superoxide dismutase
MRRTTTSRQLPLVVCASAVALFAASPALAGADHVRSSGPIVSYAPAVPQGATARVHAVYNASGDTVVTLHVWGLLPNTEYGAHAHQNPCGLTGAAAGPHFQRVPDPVQPSVNPEYANPRNEIWLDFTTDADGNASAQSIQRWQFEPDRRAHSVIIHQEHTNPGPQAPGTAGPRLGCLTVDF